MLKSRTVHHLEFVSHLWAMFFAIHVVALYNAEIKVCCSLSSTHCFLCRDVCRVWNFKTTYLSWITKYFINVIISNGLRMSNIVLSHCRKPSTLFSCIHLKKKGANKQVLPKSSAEVGVCGTLFACDMSLDWEREGAQSLSKLGSYAVVYISSWKSGSYRSPRQHERNEHIRDNTSIYCCCNKFLE